MAVVTVSNFIIMTTVVVSNSYYCDEKKVIRITHKNTSKTQVRSDTCINVLSRDNRMLGEVSSIPPRVDSVGKFGIHSKRVS